MTSLEDLLHNDAAAWQRHADGQRRDIVRDYRNARTNPIFTIEPAPQRRVQRRTKVAVAALLAVAATVVTLIAYTTLRSSTGPTVTAGATDPLRPQPVFPPVPLRPIETLQPSAVKDDDFSSPWTLTEIHGNDLTIFYAIGDDDCIVNAGVVVEQSTDFVLIEVVSRTKRLGACASRLVNARSVIRLEAPLGGRSLIHAVVSPGWERFAVPISSPTN